MALNLVWTLLGLFLFTIQSALAHTCPNQDYYKIAKIKTTPVSVEVLNQETIETISEKKIYADSLPILGNPSPIDPGKVISVAKDLVALGEDIYKLVIKGKPTNLTKYSPISVIPKINGEPVDVMETEGWQAPVKRTYRVVFENLYGIDVVDFTYSVIFAYGGSYNGAGAYLTAVQIVPESVRTLFGFDFTATMKLGGIQNLATRTNPVAGATIILEYTVNSVFVADNQASSFFVTGRGEFKRLKDKKL